MANILSIDDDPVILQIISRSLQELATVETVHDPVEGLSRYIASPHDYDVLLTDQNMGSLLKGIDVIRRVCEHEEKCNYAPFMALVASTVPEIVEEARALGAEYLPKPFTRENLRALVQRGLAQHKTKQSKI